jgi:hypothetical protein
MFSLGPMSLIRFSGHEKCRDGVHYMTGVLAWKTGNIVTTQENSSWILPSLRWT